MAELKPIIEQSMTQYAGAVLQSRALVDVRDCLKPIPHDRFSSVWIKYKYTSAKPFNKTMACNWRCNEHFLFTFTVIVLVVLLCADSLLYEYPLVEVRAMARHGTVFNNWATGRSPLY